MPILVTPRDLSILEALDLTPLTARQLLRLSATFAEPFGSEHKVRSRMRKLVRARRVREWPCLVAGRGAPLCYSLTREGFGLVHGPNAPVPGKRAFQRVAIARQQHTFALAEFIVHLLVSGKRSGIPLRGLGREGSVQLAVGDERLAPDFTFELLTHLGVVFRFFVELDNSTERVRSDKDRDSWERKIRLYEAYQDQTASRFRVLVIATRSSERLTHILEAARTLTANPYRSLFYGIRLQDFLEAPEAITSPCFTDHRGRRVALLPPLPQPDIQPTSVEATSLPTAVAAW